MKRVLVFGGAGLVGSHLVDRLLGSEREREVIAVDDLSRGSFASLAHLKRTRRFAFVEHDVANPFRVAEVDGIFHLAVPSSRAACALDPVKAVMSCVRGTMNVLEVAAATGARVVLATSSERWGEGVRCAEALALELAARRGVDVRIVRLPSAYGPRMAPDGDHVVTSLVRQAVRGENLSAGIRLDRRIHLAYVDDLVETLVRTIAAERVPRVVAAASSEVVVEELAYMIAEAAGLIGPALAYVAPEGPPSVPGALRPSLADAVPASLALGQTTSVELAEGLERTVRWFEARLGLARAGGRTSGVYTREAAEAADAAEAATTALRTA